MHDTQLAHSGKILEGSHVTVSGTVGRHSRSGFELSHLKFR